MQLDLFSPPAPSSPTLTAPSSVLSPLIGLRVELPRPCRCGCSVGVIGSSGGPHANRIACSACGGFCRWLGHREASFVAAIAEKFGAPSSPIVIRGGV